MNKTSRNGLAVLAGRLSFVGAANAADIVVDGSYESETNAVPGQAQARSSGNDAADFDGGWTHFSTNNYSAGYTQAWPGRQVSHRLCTMNTFVA